MNSKKIILDLCGGTGSWSKPYKDAGYTVYNLTLPDCDLRTDIELYEDKIFIGHDTYLPIKDIYGILAAPPCTMFSFARTTAIKPRDFTQGLELVNICQKIIQWVRLYGNLKFWAMENPTGYLRQFIGKPYLQIQPFEYGDPYAKKTDLWGYFNQPKKKPIVLSEEIKNYCYFNNRVMPRLPEGYRSPEGRNYAARRAMTPRGFANAFYKANQ